MTRGWLALGGVLLAACSAGGGGSDDDDAAGGAGAGVGATGGTEIGGGPVGGSGAGASGAGGPSVLLPLAVGYGWTYDVAAVGAGSVCAAGQQSYQVVGSQSLAGRSAFEATNWCTGVAGTSFYAPGAGDEVFFYYGGAWLTLIDPTLEEGHSWDYFNTSYSWHQEPTVSVPIGTLSDCWTAVQNVSYTAYLTYCRGVGLVRSYSQDLAGNGWDAQLSAKTF
jgi:hypothetical protein